MHLLILTESMPEGTEEFKKWLTSQNFSTGGHPVMREIKLYDVNIKESDEQRVVDMLIPQEVELINGKEDITKVGDMIVDMLPGLQSIMPQKEIARKKRKEGKLTEPHYTDTKKPFCYVYMIGKLKDDFQKDGVELI